MYKLLLLLEECCLLGCYRVAVGRAELSEDHIASTSTATDTTVEVPLQEDIFPHPSLRYILAVSQENSEPCHPEDGGDTFRRNVGNN
jgi:hypothetical protein